MGCRPVHWKKERLSIPMVGAKYRSDGSTKERKEYDQHDNDNQTRFHECDGDHDGMGVLEGQ